ncbi:uncharacterized protein [Zea mays]|uniref:uncharacterized protein isoform X3 n=1 Tax=Zea mays TaxID=4577 RepID=UPI001651E072|nr:uncharacterized protein LOC115032971 isoform X3 [Zea mays]
MGLKRPTAGAGEAAAQTITLSMSAMWDTVRAAMREAEAAALEPTQSPPISAEDGTVDGGSIPAADGAAGLTAGIFGLRL